MKRLLAFILCGVVATLTVSIVAQEDQQTFEIATADMQASNGVVHSIDTVLMPPGFNMTSQDANAQDANAQDNATASEEVPSKLPQFVQPGGDLDQLAGGNLDAILDDPEAYYDQRVFFEAGLGELFQATGIDALDLIQDDGLSEDAILAIDPVGNLNLPQFAYVDANAFIVGTVRLFIEADIEDEFGIDLDDVFFADYDQEPVIVIEDIALEVDDAQAFVDGTAPGLAVPDSLPELVTDNSDLDKAAEDNFQVIMDRLGLYLGREVFFEANIDTFFEDLGADVIELGDGDLLAIDTTGNLGLMQIAEGDADVFIIGTLRLLELNTIEEEFDIDLEGEFFQDYDGQPVLIISAIAQETDEPSDDITVDEEPTAEMDADQSEQTVVDVIASSPDHTILAQAIETAGLTDALSDPEATYTVFAPTDAAFETLLNEMDMTFDDLLSDEDALTSILQYHVVGGDMLLASDLQANAQELNTLSGDVLRFDLSS